MRTAPRVLAAVAGILALAGCSMDYRAAEVAEKTAAGVPDTVATGIVHKIFKDGHLSFVLEASQAQTFNSQKETIISNASFEELDDKGKVVTNGQAGKIVYHSDTENAEISGLVSVHSASEKAQVTADSLSWQNKEKRLTAAPGEVVTVKKDDGSFLRGTGFVGDFRTRQVTYSGRVEGTYVWEEKKK
ncbi:MAG TPA: LPS export ABC transporter periplasmic protein LptC [Spirochaetia bacterium]|nr:LPS export ABC transporter periplasmic protein LptC [Spirochaetia bacterium]